MRKLPRKSGISLPNMKTLLIIGSQTLGRTALTRQSMALNSLEFAGADDAKAEIRAAVGYLLRGATGGTRGDIVQAIISIVRQVAAGLPPVQPYSLDDGLPGG
jgi:hypothetical protein